VSLIKTVNLSKNYKEASGKLEVLKDINLEINKGEMVAITGQSGSGKSTLLHILGLLDTPSHGEIYFEGKLADPFAKKVNEFRNKRIGFVFQFHYLLDDFTAEENAAMPMFIATGDFQKSKAEAGKLLKLMDIYDRKDHYPNELSGGEQQRVAVARALINKPDVVFADEPTGNLDEEHSAELIDLLMKLNKENGQTIVLVTHNKEIAGRAKTHYILEKGVLTQ
jgi:lipoprotein-releasing system ATP-binding protein